MKKRLLSFLLAVCMTAGLLCTTAYAASAESILNSASLSPDHFLAEGSNDYWPEYFNGAFYQYYIGVDFLPEDADALLVETINAQTTSSMSTYQKVKALYDYIIDNTEYGYGGMGNYCSVYSVLVEGIGTCEDYNYVMMAFLRYLGIDAALVHGQTHKSSGGYTGHAWVEAYINGVTYVFDPQIDDNIAGGGTVYYYRFCKTYSEVSDKYILEDDTYYLYLASSYSENFWYITVEGKYTLRDAELDTVTAEELEFELEGASLTGWYYDEACTQPVDLDAEIHRDLMIWAGFSVDPFTDVSTLQYYADPVVWAVDSGITTGTTETTFSPDETCTRGQVVTFLYRAAGEPELSGAENPFSDISSSDYYYSAVLWAVENGITTGTTKTTFSPDETCTRGQVVTFLYRYLGTEITEADNPFTDVGTGDYFYTPVLWAVENGVTTGTTAATFSPEDACTRGQVVTFLYRALAE